MSNRVPMKNDCVLSKKRRRTATPIRFAAAMAAMAFLLNGLFVARRADAGDAAPPRSYPFKITTTVGMVTDIVKQVAGDRATATEPTVLPGRRYHFAITRSALEGLASY